MLEAVHYQERQCDAAGRTGYSLLTVCVAQQQPDRATKLAMSLSLDCRRDMSVSNERERKSWEMFHRYKFIGNS